MEQSQDLNIDLIPKRDTSKLQVTIKHHFPHTILLKKAFNHHHAQCPPEHNPFP